MGNCLNIGNDGVTMVRKGKYVDKTGLIAFINSTLETPLKLTCVSRPRRFGKSFAAKMLCAYMTGILPIKKYGTQSALTDFKEYNMLEPKKLEKYVGFTEDEVMNLCDEYDMDNESAYIPNEEVRSEFVRAVKYGKHKEVSRLVQNSDRLLKATLALDSETVANAIEDAHSEGTAPIYYNDEQALRSVIRFAYISCIDEYL